MRFSSIHLCLSYLSLWDASAELLFDFRDFGDGEFDPFLCLPFDSGNELRASLRLELVVSGIAKP